jgi:plastocyanin
MGTYDDEVGSDFRYRKWEALSVGNPCDALVRRRVMRRIHLGVGAMAMVAVLMAASCGGDNKSSSDTPVSLEGKVNNQGEKDVKNGDSIEMEADDFYFGPTFLKGPAGAKVTLELHNEGKATHTFTVDSLSVDQKLEPDASANVEVTIPASGSLVYYCQFHQNQGMQGALVTA